MKHYFSIWFIFVGLIFYSSCNDDAPLDLSYQINLLTPEANSYNLGDILPIQVEFQELNGGTIFNVNVRIYNKTDGVEIYNKPDLSNIQITDGYYYYEDDFALANIAINTEWILEARVWGEESGSYEIIKTIEILIAP